MNYFDKVHKAYPEIHNYENAVIENKYFSSCGMNDEGKNIYECIIHDFFKTKNENSLPYTRVSASLTGNSGIGTSIKNLAVGLVAAGCEVRVLV
jgi:hypothetical protein